MIRLNRLKHADPLYLNPDHIEWLEQHAETTVRLSNGREYIVTDTVDQIIAAIREERAAVLAMVMGLIPTDLRRQAPDGEVG